MGYFLTKLAAKAEENERTVGGTALGAGRGIGAAALGAGAIGGGAYGGAKLWDIANAAYGNRANRLASRAHDEIRRINSDAAKNKRKLTAEERKTIGKLEKQYTKNIGRGSNAIERALKAEGFRGKMLDAAKKNWKLGVPAVLGAGALGGGLLLND